MDEGLISKRYAKALLEYAAARGQDEAVYGRMKLLAQVMRAMPRLYEALASPVVPREDKAALVVTASGGGEAEEGFVRFVQLVLRHERERLLHSMALSYMNLYRYANRITVVSVITAMPMSKMVFERIRRDVELRTRGPVEMETEVDPSIEGGMIFQINDMRLDASVRGQLEKVRRQFMQKNKIIV